MSFICCCCFIRKRLGIVGDPVSSSAAAIVQRCEDKPRASGLLISFFVLEYNHVVDISGLSAELSRFVQTGMAMVVAPLSPGVVVRLRELHSASSPFTDPNQSLRVVGSLERFDAASGIAVLADDEGGCSLRVDLEHVRALSLRVGSLFEFIGELQVRHLEELTLKARVGRNVDGMDLRLLDKVLQFRRKFEEECGNY